MEKRRTMLVGIVSIVLLISAAFGTTQAVPVVVNVSPSSIVVSQGQTFTVNITVDPKGNEVCAAQYVLLYSDNNLLNTTSQTQGPFLSQDGLETIVVANIINNTLGKVEYGEFRTGEGLEHGVTAPGTLASITFEVIGTAGTSNLKLSDVILTGPDEKELETEINDAICTIGNATGEPAIADITAEEAHKTMKANPEEIILLDVRTEEEHEAEYIDMPGVELRNIPKDELENRLGELDKSKKIIVYCRTGSRSNVASKALVEHGFEHVYNMLGGIEEWKNLGFPISSLLTPKPTPTITMPVTPSPAPTVSPVVSPTPTSTPMPGFEAAFAILGLLATSYPILKRRRADKK